LAEHAPSIRIDWASASTMPASTMIIQSVKINTAPAFCSLGRGGGQAMEAGEKPGKKARARGLPGGIGRVEATLL
jgi:hypothetical protein